ncbi:uncharacterized protein LOC122870442 [Siniperca chuatsi]|uniref:uncharacterized protein LOC122870442 n=1 Tax=Siniperca chuatsi TaxID=119488 RepID=UPI001CE0E09B|nr:uncharacterized protein LOC122870442 [Siniperca chuatsi]
MKLLLSSLLRVSLCALSSWNVSSGTVVVTQTPDVSVTEGERVHITCCWTREFERITINWLKNQTDIKIEIFGLTNHSQGSLRKETSDCSNLTLANITRKDSGRYICKLSVEIPFLTVAEGNGTVITVTDRESTTQYNTAGEHGHPDSTNNPLPFPMIISLAVVGPLLFITLVCFCTLRRRQAQAARVIYEVPHIDSEEAEMDKQSTSSSRGSSQWCQVAVYESFDYFERVEIKESG